MDVDRLCTSVGNGPSVIAKGKKAKPFGEVSPTHHTLVYWLESAFRRLTLSFEVCIYIYISFFLFFFFLAV